MAGTLNSDGSISFTVSSVATPQGVITTTTSDQTGQVVSQSTSALPVGSPYAAGGSFSSAPSVPAVVIPATQPPPAPVQVVTPPTPPTPPAPTSTSAAGTSQYTAAGSNPATVTSSIPLLDSINNFIASHTNISSKTLAKLEELGLAAAGGAITTAGISSFLTSTKKPKGKAKHTVKTHHKKSHKKSKGG